MRTLPRYALSSTLQVYDAGVISLALLLATVLDLPGGMSLADVLTLRVKLVNFLLLAVFLLGCSRLFARQGLYQSRRLAGRLDDAIDIVIAVSLAAAALGVGGTVFRVELVTPLFVSVFWATTSAAIVGSRLLLRAMLARMRRQGRNLRNVLIVGTNDRAVRFARKLDAKPDLGYSLLGFADEPWAGLGGAKLEGYRVVSDSRYLEDFLRHTVVDEVVIALPLKSKYHQVHGILKACERQGIVVRLVSGLFNLKTAQTKAEEFGDETVLSVFTGNMDGWPVVLKQCADVVIAGLLVLAVSPVLALVALAIKLTSPGPVMFIQERVGMGKRLFHLYKFRTMVVDAEKQMSALEKLNEAEGPVFKIRNDPRITRVGRFLRKTSLDELPQLFNVLKGDMSLVGPRPLPVRDYNGFDEDWHRRRFSVRPGITCLWQVKGRSDIQFDEWMKLDMEYIDRWSLWLDLKILFKTVPAVLRGSGAA
jgi:exopolysaccharide biosynthesis polyprenyl glycosylphosphotransferase